MVCRQTNASSERCSALDGAHFPKRYVHPESVNVSLFGKGIFADVIKLRNLSRRDDPGVFRWSLNPVTNVLIRETQERFGKHWRRRCDGDRA